jgi:hypothetical protein
VHVPVCDVRACNVYVSAKRALPAQAAAVRVPWSGSTPSLTPVGGFRTHHQPQWVCPGLQQVPCTLRQPATHRASPQRSPWLMTWCGPWRLQADQCRVCFACHLQSASYSLKGGGVCLHVLYVRNRHGVGMWVDGLARWWTGGAAGLGKPMVGGWVEPWWERAPPCWSARRLCSLLHPKLGQTP